MAVSQANVKRRDRGVESSKGSGAKKKKKARAPIQWLPLFLSLRSSGKAFFLGELGLYSAVRKTPTRRVFVSDQGEIAKNPKKAANGTGGSRASRRPIPEEGSDTATVKNAEAEQYVHIVAGSSHQVYSMGEEDLARLEKVREAYQTAAGVHMFGFSPARKVACLPADNTFILSPKADVGDTAVVYLALHELLWTNDLVAYGRLVYSKGIHPMLIRAVEQGLVLIQLHREELITPMADVIPEDWRQVEVNTLERSCLSGVVDTLRRQCLPEDLMRNPIADEMERIAQGKRAGVAPPVASHLDHFSNMRTAIEAFLEEHGGGG